LCYMLPEQQTLTLERIVNIMPNNVKLVLRWLCLSFFWLWLIKNEFFFAVWENVSDNLKYSIKALIRWYSWIRISLASLVLY
jgi:hypothetical protein